MDQNIVLQVIASLFGLSGQYFVNQRKISGLYLWLLANVVIVTFQAINGFWIFAALHTVYFAMTLHGIYLWTGRKPVKEILGFWPAKASSTMHSFLTRLYGRTLFSS